MPQAITISGPPEDAKLIFESMTGHEELGRLFEFKLNLLSENKAVKIDDVLGKNLTVTIEFSSECLCQLCVKNVTPGSKQIINLHFAFGIINQRLNFLFPMP